MKKKSDTKANQTRGKIMVFVGFIMIIFNALSYILAWERDLIVLGILGLVFVGVGLRMARGKGKF
jgi:cadmium resistance protein CadD (predicted permease)